MPAFDVFTSGLNVLDDALRPFFRRHRLEAWITGKSTSALLRASWLLPD
jgi:hypothetical protein